MHQNTEILYRDHNLWLRGWLRRKLGCSETAADLAHDTFIRLLTNRQLASRLQKLRAFLVKVAQDHVDCKVHFLITINFIFVI